MPSDLSLQLQVASQPLVAVFSSRHLVSLIPIHKLLVTSSSLLFN